MVNHQDFMLEVINKIENQECNEYSSYTINYDPRIKNERGKLYKGHDGKYQIDNLGILYIEYTSGKNNKHIFLMRHCYACHNIKSKGITGLFKDLYNKFF